VKYQDAHGSWTHAVLQGLEARCFQHELDHLDGVLTIDRTTPEAKREALRILREQIV
jgi:peptide deformylase